MAKVISPEFTIAATDVYELGDASAQSVSTTVLQAIGTGWTGTVTVKGRARGSSQAYKPIQYKRRSLGAVASDDTVVSAILTNTDFIIAVDAAGLDIALDVVVTGGTLAVSCRDVEG